MKQSYNPPPPPEEPRPEPPPAPPRLHPKWGYDLDRVKDVHCLHCGERIGDEPYVEVTVLARFGQMTFLHKRCLETLEMEERGKRTT